MKIHHIGYAVKNLNDSINEFKKLGYQEEGGCVSDPVQKVMIQFMTSGAYRIELIAPDGESSPVLDILKKLGDTPYHICYETSNIKNTIEQLKKEHYFLLNKSTPAPAISNCPVAFLYKRGVGILELVENK